VNDLTKASSKINNVIGRLSAIREFHGCTDTTKQAIQKCEEILKESADELDEITLNRFMSKISDSEKDGK
jgi:hypothetical protein